MQQKGVKGLFAGLVRNSTGQAMQNYNDSECRQAVTETKAGTCVKMDSE